MLMFQILSWLQTLNTELTKLHEGLINVTCSLVLHTCSKLVTLCLNYINNMQFHL